jgi:hypothetical protein
VVITYPINVQPRAFVLVGTDEHVTAAETGTAPETDYALAQKASQGDMVAFEELYQRHNRRVYYACG